MKISIYKIDEQLFGNDNKEFESVDDFLVSKAYVEHSLQVEVANDYGISIWIQMDSRLKMKWQVELQELMSEYEKKLKDEESVNGKEESSQLFSDLGTKYNSILVISKKEKGCNNKIDLYAIPFGNAYNDVEKICDPNFGVDVASRVFDNQSISITNVNMYFQSTLRQMTNYKKSTYVQSKSSESFDALIGSPIEKYTNLLGKNVSCSKSFSISKYDLVSYLETMMPFFSNYKELEVSISLPKVEKLSKNNPITSTLNDKLLELIKKDSHSLISLSGYKIVNGEIRLIESEISKIYVKGASSTLFSEMDSETDNINTIINFIKNDVEENPLQDYKVSVTNDDEKFTAYNLLDIVQTEVEHNENSYVLSEGYWCEFNASYLEKLDEYVSKIEVRLNENIKIKRGQLSVKPSEDRITEDDYIDTFRTKSNYFVAHEKMVKPLKNGKPFGNGIELCDVVIIENPKTLVSIKKGFSTVSNAYSIDQSLLSLLILLNPKDFELGSLSEHLDAERIAIQWILPVKANGDPYSDKTHTKNVCKNLFELVNLRSIILKNKLMEWDSRVKEIDKKPIIYIDAPIQTT